MNRIDVEMSSPDPVMKVLLRQVQAFPVDCPERHEVEAFLYTTLARASWRTADEIRRRHNPSPDPRKASE